MFGRTLRRAKPTSQGLNEIHLSPSRLSELLDSSPDPITVAVDERVIYTNTASCRALGLSDPSEFVGQSIFKFVHPDDLAHAREKVARVAEAREAAVWIEVRVVAPNGQLDLQVWASSIRVGREPAIMFHGVDQSARLAAQRQLHESEERYRRLAENSSDVISEFTIGGELVYMSPSVERLLGYPTSFWQDATNNRALELTHPDDIQAQVDFWNAPVRPETGEFLHRVKHVDGELRSLHTLARRITTREGQERVLMTTRDVTERQRALEALRKSEQRYQSLASAVPVGIFRIDHKGRHVYMNERWAELTGVSIEAGLAHPERRSLHPEDNAKIFELSMQALRDRKPLRLEQRIIRPDGEVRCVLTQALPEFDAAGAFAGWVGTLTDLSDKKASEHALAESEARLRLALDAANMCCWEWDTRNDRVNWSANAARVLGLADDELPQRPASLVALAHPEDRDFGIATASACLERGESFEVEFRLAPSGGEEPRWVVMRGHGLPGSTGSREGAIGVIGDISSRRRLAAERETLELKLVEAKRLESLGLLAGGVAHDFNNLLVGILGNAALALGSTGEAPLREHLLGIQRAGEQAADLVRQILTYAGSERSARETLELGALVADTLELLRPSLPARAQLSLETPSEPLIAEADPTQLRQVVMNLVSNACESLGANGGFVTVSLSRVGAKAVNEHAALPQRETETSWLCLEVADTGSGIPPAVRARIFDPFFTTKAVGRGLGLPVVQGIARAHGGAVGVESAPGRGTRMHLILPERSGGVTARPVERERAPLPQPALAPMVLIVDDDSGVREVARLSLERAGYRALCAAGGESALRLVREHAREIALVLLDLSLGAESGEEVLEALRKLAEHTPVLATSGYAAAEAFARLERHGIAGFVPKPFTPAELARAVAEALAVASR
jgi:PAS domain S-box-containing protein